LKSVDTHDSTKLHLNQQQHTMILHRDDEENTVTKYVSEALKKGYLTVYLPLTRNTYNNNSSDLSKIALSENKDFKENMNWGNLLTFDTRTFYNFALAGNLEPFEELKVLIEEAIEEKKNILSKRKEANEDLIVVVVAEVAAELNRDKKFGECIKLEEWWQKTHSEWLHKGLKVAIICPHLIPKLDKDEFTHYRQAIASLHEIVDALP
jgi:outer membrane usher protein FimD/PapC